MSADKAFIYRPVNIPPSGQETITGLFLKRVARTPQATAYRYYDHVKHAWQSSSWEETAQQVARWQQGLKHEGLQKGDRIAIMGRNSPHWVVVDQAAQGLGLAVVPLYVNDQPDDVLHIIRHSGARLLVIDSDTQWQLLKQNLQSDEQLLRIVSIEDINSDTGSLVSAGQWLPVEYNNRIENLASPEDLATIVYTSGTTGSPKGVMLSHNNIVSNVSACMQAVPVCADDTFLSFLPLSHMLERTVGYYLPILGGSIVVFTRGIPLLAEDIKTIRPTRLISVPRIYERIHAHVDAQLETKPELIKKLFTYAVETGWNYFNYRQGRAKWLPRYLLLPLLNLIFARKLQKQLGGRLISAICGGAPLSSGISKTFLGLGIPVLHGYGLTEASPVVSVNRLDNNIPASIGLPLAGVEVTTGNNEELLVRGDSVMKGYWKDEDATEEAIGRDNWLHTGDKARIENGFIYITGRLKEIIVLSTGEKVSPVDMELAITSDPLIEQAIIIGEGCPYLTAVVVLNGDQLTADTVEDSEEMETILLDKIAGKLHAFPGHEQVKRLHYTREYWTVKNELLTPTFKLKRRNIIKRFRKEIAALYEGHTIYNKEITASF